MKVELGLITGTGISSFDELEKTESVQVKTPYGTPSSDVQLGRIGKTGVAYILRHGREKNVPPHMINHRANIWALREIGASRILSTTSVGSLKLAIKPPTIVVPDDYVCFSDVQTFFDEKIVHITPGMDGGLRKLALASAKKLKIPARDGGVYVQTSGPRLETPAEIRVLKDWGDLIGMNMASEATLAREVGLAYANISSVDNYGNGLSKVAPTYEAIVANAKRNWLHVSKILAGVARGLA